MGLSESIKFKALELGFDLVGITGAERVDAGSVERFSKWIESGFCGQMDYMRRNLDKRIDPSKLLAGARSVICVGLNYRPAEDPQESEHDSDKHLGKVANFALYEDYHDFIYCLAGCMDGNRGRYEYGVCRSEGILRQTSRASRNV